MLPMMTALIARCSGPYRPFVSATFTRNTEIGRKQWHQRGGAHLRSAINRWNSSKKSCSDHSCSGANSQGTKSDTNEAFLGGTKILDPLVVCGVSGVGKGTVITRFLEVQDEQLFHLHQTQLHIKDAVLPKFIEFVFTVSHTTRPPRPNEKNGVHYHFVSTGEMKRFISMGKDSNSSISTNALLGPNSSFFVEHATIYDNVYGTSWAALEAAHFKPRSPPRAEPPGGHNPSDEAADPPPKENSKITRKAILDIDVQGVQQLKELELTLQGQFEQGHEVPYLLRPKYIFISPPGFESLKERLQARGTELQESFERRMDRAIGEMNYGLQLLCYKFDQETDNLYRKSFHFPRVVVNSVSVNHTVDDFMVAIDRVYDMKDRPPISATGKEDEEIGMVYEDYLK
jgi:guanylate kinase